MQALMCISPFSSDMEVDHEGETVTLFDMLDDSLILSVLRSFETPGPLCSVAVVNKRFAALCADSFLWQPLLSSVLSGGRSWLAWAPCTNTPIWRERYRQWHTLSNLRWVRCDPRTEASVPSERFLHRAAAVHGDLVFVYGGRGPDECELGDLWIIRPDEAVRRNEPMWELVKPTTQEAPMARLSATLVAVDAGTHQGLVMFGGRCGDTFLNDAWLFHTGRRAWCLLSEHMYSPAGPDVPAGRWAHSAVAHRGKEVVVFGGSAPGQCFNEVHSLHLPTGERAARWEVHQCSGSRPTRRSGHSVARVGSSMYIFGGNTTRESFNDTWEYNMDSRTWAAVKTRVRREVAGSARGVAGGWCSDGARVPSPSPSPPRPLLTGGAGLAAVRARGACPRAVRKPPHSVRRPQVHGKLFRLGHALPGHAHTTLDRAEGDRRRAQAAHRALRHRLRRCHDRFRRLGHGRGLFQ